MLPSTPTVLCLVLADSVHRDPDSGNHTVIGILRRVLLAPGRRGDQPVWIYAELTGARGTRRVELCVDRLGPKPEDRQTIIRAPFEVVFPDPRSIVTLPISLPELDAFGPGEFGVILTCNGSRLVERPLTVRSPSRNGR